MARRGMQFGSAEDLNCLSGIQRFEIETNDGTVEVCYAARVVTDSFILPWRIYIKDYVFSNDGNSYYIPNEGSVKYLQSEGTLPNPIPDYSLTKVDLVSGNFLWIGLGIMFAYAGIRSFFDKEDAIEKESENKN